MNLLYKLPPCESAVLSSSGEEPVYCIPCDISNGRIAKDWLAVTKTRVLLLRGGKIDKYAYGCALRGGQRLRHAGAYR